MAKGVIWTGGFAMKEAVTVAIVAGVLTVAQSMVIVTTETGSSDDLDRIEFDPDFMVSGYQPPLYLFAASGKTIAIKHETVTVGNISLASGSDFSLSGKKCKALLRPDDASFFTDF